MNTASKSNDESSTEGSEMAEPPDPKKNKSHSNKATSRIKTAMAILGLLSLMITMISGAQIGTSQSEISIIQIESIILKRSTWLTEENENKKETIKIIKGQAIISERYIEEAHLIAKKPHRTI